MMNSKKISMSSQHKEAGDIVVGKKRIATVIPIRAPAAAVVRPTGILQQPARTLALKPRQIGGMTGAASSPGMIKSFSVKRGGSVVFDMETVEWKYSYLLDESGLSVDGNQLVAFKPGDTWVVGTVQLKPRVNNTM